WGLLHIRNYDAPIHRHDLQRILEKRVVDLEEQVASLTKVVNELQMGQGQVIDKPITSKKASRKISSQGETSEEILSWVDKSYILSRVATTSFIVAIALALRTAADSGIIDLQMGSFVGMLYALGLLVYGWFAYKEKSIQAPVFILWGTIIMCGVVVEAHRVFATVPTEMAYVAMAITGLVTTIISRVHHVALPVFVGTLGMSFGSFALNYPSPVFPYLVIILGLANIFATYATRLLRASWLRWLLLVLTLFMVQIWDLKLAIYLGRLSPENLDFSVKGLLPSITFLGLVFVSIAFLGVMGKVQEKISKFDVVLPVINVCWIYLAASYAIGQGLTTYFVFGTVAMIAALGHLGIAWCLVNRAEGGALGTTPFAMAGGLLMAFAAPMAIGHAVIGTALVALLAIGMAWVSVQRSNLGLRLTSYLLQLYACSALVVLLWATDGTKPSVVGALSSGLLASIAFLHYFWARRHPPVDGDTIMDKLNKNDRGASVLLIASLISGFFTMRVGLYQVLDFLHVATQSAFGGAQSVLINVTAAVLLWLSLVRRNKELRNVAVVITVVGAGKVFMMDMVQLNGMPLMISVFTFGLVAALASFVLGRWNKSSDSDVKATVDPAGS
ncbi:MAG: hypothetical protein JRC99_12345, partial [Deltaproteobacteria bacterium]|nr:hypothetical protein [Deltaproteobacteria bacterium]